MPKSSHDPFKRGAAAASPESGQIDPALLDADFRQHVQMTTTTRDESASRVEDLRAPQLGQDMNTTDKLRVRRLTTHSSIRKR